MAITVQQQVLSQSLVNAMAVNIMATAMGVMMSSLGPAAYTVKPSELKGTSAALRELRLAFGGVVVDTAAKNVGTDSMVALAKEVDRLVTADMVLKYGSLATEAALAAAPPGDVNAAKEIAKTLAGRGIRSADMSQWLSSATPTQKENVVETAKRRSAGRHPAKPVLDLRTNIQYRSHAAAGVALAAEYGLDKRDTHVWFEILRKDPARFKDISVLSPRLPVAATEPMLYTPPPLATTAPRVPEASLSLQEAMSKYETERIAKPAAAASMQPETLAIQSKKSFIINKSLPEWQQVLYNMSHMDIPGNKLLKPKKFVEKIEVIKTPAQFNPSGISDTAFLHSYSWDGKVLTEGPSYSYDSMMNIVGSPFERNISIPRGSRVWICIYDGAMGGFWRKVDVFVNADDFAQDKYLQQLA